MGCILSVNIEGNPGSMIFEQKVAMCEGAGWRQNANTDTFMHARTLFVGKTMLFRHYLNYIIAQSSSQSEPNVPNVSESTSLSLCVSVSLSFPLGVPQQDYS